MADLPDAGAEQPGQGAAALRPGDVLLALRRLDRLLDWALTLLQEPAPTGQAPDPFRGVYISQAEAERLLAREPGVPAFGPADDAGSAPDAVLAESLGATSRLAWLKRAYDLAAFDLDLVVIALAPEVDLRYERLYGYLQDDLTRRRPSVDLALNLLCPTAEARLARRAHVTADAPLVRHGLLRISPDPNHVQPPLLAQYLRLDEQVAAFLLGDDGLDARLVPFCQQVVPAATFAGLPLPEETRRALAALATAGTQHPGREVAPPRLYFHGPPGGGQRQAAEALAAQAGVPLLAVDLARALVAAPDVESRLKLAFRHARFQGAIVYLHGLEAVAGEDRAVTYHWLLAAVADHAGPVVLAGAQAPGPLGLVDGRASLSVIPLAFGVPDLAGRRACWAASLATVDLSLDADELEVLAGRFRLTPGQIAGAAASAREQARWRAAAESAALATETHAPQPLVAVRPSRRRGARQSDPPVPPRNGKGQTDGPARRPGPTLGELFAAARLHSSHNLGTLARKITPHYAWADLVLPADRLEQLREICNHVKYRALVYDTWGFDRRLAMGKGLNVLFAGPSGTGKTMAADVMAGELGLDLYKIDLATVVSKYIGETEKNLARIFAEAESSNAILFFDEADALFGRRSEVRDSHDRYANIEISYLLQRMEEYEGVVILATNLRKNMDDAFVRRVHFSVDFPFPSEQDRKRIWEAIWPDTTPRGPDLDLAMMARRFELAGGNIRNIALAAAFLAADDGAIVDMAHLLHATRREYQKMGKVVADGMFGHPGVAAPR